MSSILIRYPNAEVAQLVEHWSEEPGVVSSILTLGTSNADVMELVYVLVLESKFCEFESRHPHQVWRCDVTVA